MEAGRNGVLIAAAIAPEMKPGSGLNQRERDRRDALPDWMLAALAADLPPGLEEPDGTLGSQPQT